MTEPSTIPQFVTRPKAADDTTDALPPYRFQLDGVEMSARKPKDALVAELAPVQSRRTPAMQKIRISLNFLEDCVEEPGKTILRERLLNPEDELDVEDVMPILEAIGDHWKAHQASRKR